MRILYNPNHLFKDVKKEKIKIYTDRILEFARAMDKVEGPIPQELIDYFKIKKMKGTNSIFKFYLNNEDGARCLIKYEENDPQIFREDKGIILLRAIDHDNQGIVGRKLDNEFINYDNFLYFEDDDEYYGNDKDFDDILGREYFKTVYFDTNISTDDLLNKMLEIDNRAIYKLSNNQLKAVNEKGPILLMGSAGSGKTLVEISKALKNAHSDIKQAYFTFTPLLKQDAEKIYEKYQVMPGLKGKTDFYVMKDYFLEELGLKEYNYFSFEAFKLWFRKNGFKSKYRWMKDFDEVQLWTEIRGLIKGYIGNDYYRILTFSNEKNKFLKKDEIDFYLSEGIIKRVKGSNSTYNIVKSETLRELIYDTDKKFHNYLIYQDLKTPYLDEYSYLNMNERYTTYSIEDRKNILDFMEIYQDHLKKNKLYDDNDLARMMLERIENNQISKFDYLLIDELQDLTEMQTLSLARLVKDPRNIMMAGDVSQVVNPTFFMDGRIGVIFRNQFRVKLNTNIKLNENYRNSENIIKVIRELLKVRQQKLGKYTSDIEEVSTELDKKEGLPIFINLEKNTFLEVIKNWIGVPRVAIIVSSEEKKKKLYSYYGLKSETNIYTVHEIKGQEFLKILTFDIISDFNEEWDYIMSGNVEKGGDLVNQYRYYFNLLYVAITRGRENLFMFETLKDSKIIEEIIPYFENIDLETIEVLDVKEYDSYEAILEQAEIHFREKEYLRAQTMYLRINNKVMSQVSEAMYNLESNSITEGLLGLIRYPNYYELAYNYINKNKNLLLYIIIAYNLNKIDLSDINSMVGNKSLISLVDDYKYVDDETYIFILKEAVRIMGDYKSYSIKQQIANIKGGLYG